MTGAVATESTGLTPDSSAGPAVPALSAWSVLVAGVIGLVASVTLTLEKIDILLDPAYVPSCNINPILSCGSVMITPQASLLGFPNPLIGLVAFTVVVVTGLLAVTKVVLPQWYWIGLTAGLVVGAVFVHWLIFQSLYRIGALCPYCMVVWVVTIALLVVVASIAYRPALGDRRSGPGWLLFQWRWSIVALWFNAVFLLIMVRFWDYLVDPAVGVRG
ncbi:vitamin K epoxide reductase [Mycobacterium lepraemurium]|nr:vitamin K epoxide reductase [Mycobacterium lepraemurium]